MDNKITKNNGIVSNVINLCTVPFCLQVLVSNGYVEEEMFTYQVIEDFADSFGHFEVFFVFLVFVVFFVHVRFLVFTASSDHFYDLHGSDTYTLFVF